MVKLTRAEKIQSVAIGLLTGLALIYLVQDVLVRMLVLAGLIAGFILLMMIPIFRVSYTIRYSTGKSSDEVKNDLLDEKKIPLAMMDKRGFELEEEDDREVVWKAYATPLHKLVGRERKIRLELSEKSGEKLASSKYVNGKLRSESETRIESVEDGTQLVEENDVEGRVRGALIFGLLLQRKVLREVMNEKGYSFEGLSIDVGIL